MLEYFKKEGKKVYEPDQNAFRTYAQKKYVERYGKDWPNGALERINAIRYSPRVPSGQLVPSWPRMTK